MQNQHRGTPWARNPMEILRKSTPPSQCCPTDDTPVVKNPDFSKNPDFPRGKLPRATFLLKSYGNPKEIHTGDPQRNSLLPTSPPEIQPLPWKSYGNPNRIHTGDPQRRSLLSTIQPLPRKSSGNPCKINTGEPTHPHTCTHQHNT